MSEGSPVKLEVKVQGFPRADLKWLHNGEEIVPDDSRIKISSKPDGTVCLTIDKATLDDAGEYRVVATNCAGSETSSALLSVISDKGEPVDDGEKPKFIYGLENCTVEVDAPIKLQVQVTGNPKPELTFLHDGQEVKPNQNVQISESPDGTATLSIQKAGLEDSGEYKVIATNKLGTAASNAVVIVGCQPCIISGLEDLSISEGLPVRFKAKVDGIPRPEVKWLHNGEEIRPDHDRVQTAYKQDGTAILTINKAFVADGGDYRIVATNIAGKAASNALLSVSPDEGTIGRGRKPTVIVGLEDQQVQVGQPVKLEVEITGLPLPRLKWLFNGEEIIPQAGRVRATENPDGTASLSITEATPNDEGDYRVVATNELGIAVSDAKLSVVLKPTFVKGLKDLDIVEDTPILLEVKVESYPTSDLKWLHNGEEIVPDGKRVNITHSPDGTSRLSINKATVEDGGDFRVVATNQIGSATSNAIVSVSCKPDESGKKPIFISGLDNCKVDVGSPAKFSVKVSSSPPASLKWLHNGKEIVPKAGVIRITEQSDGSVVLLIEEAVLNDAGTYQGE